MKSREVRPFLVAGDIVSFLLVALMGMSSHDSGFTLSGLARATLPFLMPWLVIAYFTGLYSPTKYAEPLGAIRPVLTAWLPAWVIGLILRAVVWGRGLVPAFAIVTLFISAIVLLAWRLTEAALRDNNKAPARE